MLRQGEKFHLNDIVSLFYKTSNSFKNELAECVSLPGGPGLSSGDVSCSIATRAEKCDAS